MSMLTRVFIATVLALFAGLPAAAAQLDSSARAPHIQASLVSENQALVVGQTNWVALRLQPERGWHTYWRNPGEAGKATAITWQLPEDVRAGPITWPAPTQLETAGFVDYGYNTPTALLIPVHVAAGQAVGKTLALSAQVSWLVCKDICIPGGAHLGLDLPTSTGPARANPAHAALFTRTRARVPQPMPASWSTHYDVQDGRFTLGVKGVDLPHGTAFFYPTTPALINYSARQYSLHDGQGLRLSAKQSRHYRVPTANAVQGVLAITRGKGKTVAYTIDAGVGKVLPVAPTDAAASPLPPAHTGGLAIALLFALLGGLILNLMPCVFPILSIKAVGILRASTLERGQQRRQGLAYTTGVVLSCLAIAGALLALRATGSALGWGFQLQSPLFVALLACVMFTLGLSLSGVLNIGSHWMGLGQGLTRRGGARGAFFTGVLAVVVASPCTAPFMGTAMGFALSQPTLSALAVFAMLGLGLALPFLAIAFVPRLAGWLPRPGPWMESFKQFMAFPLYLTAVWLVWVLARQVGADAAALVLAAMVVLGLALWLRGRWPKLRVTRVALGVGVLGAVLLSVRAASLPFPYAAPPTAQAAIDPVDSTATVQAWTPARVAQLQAAGRTIFVDFTADWCLTCKVNERLALDSSAVRKAFANGKVALLRADWTRRDPEITAALRKFGRAGVPLYVVYRPGRQPQILPQLLTPGIVTAAVGS